MRMVDLIAKKRRGGALSREEIRFIIEGFTGGAVPDYQMAAFLMAICFQGMSDEETSSMTDWMARSGDMADLSPIQGVKVDKHSTGGVGDKTTLIAAPIAAACGVKVAKMSGRGLGHTGGTVDKLESIPGFRTSIGREEFFKIVSETGLAVVGQSGDLAPADKKIYALRDVTGTVESIPLIASSIMSKKLAAGSDCILLDVKTGSGAFMKSVEESIRLAQTMVRIGESAGKKTAALITNMDVPLGFAIGNSLEVKEAVETLRGNGPQDLTELCLELAAGMLLLAGIGTRDECRNRAEEAVRSGAALERFRRMVERQGGDVSVLDDPERFEKAKLIHTVASECDGYLVSMDAEAVGRASMILGAGRETKESRIDPAAGIVLKAKTGAFVRKGEPLAVFHTNREESLRPAEEVFRGALAFSDKPPETEPLLYARVDRDGVNPF